VGEEADGLNATLRRDRDGLPVLARILCGVERGSMFPITQAVLLSGKEIPVVS